jgi:hypothetical protein
MPSLDERVAYLEGRLEDHSGTVSFLREDLKALREDLRTGVNRLDARIDAVDGKIDRLDDKVSRHFTWIVGLQVALMIAVIGALLGS